MVKCTKCGNLLKEGQKFCIKCGTKIEDIKKNQSPELLASIDILNKKISNDNLNSLLYIELGDVYFENKVYNEAILEYQKAFAIDNNFNSIFKTAEAYRKNNEFTKAESTYKKALEIDTKSQVARIGLFWSYSSHDKLNELVDLEREIDDDKKTLDFHKALIKAYKKSGTSENVFKEMEIIHQLDSEDIENLRNLAEYFEDRNSSKKAFELYTKILSIDPKDIDSISKMCKYHCYQKDYIKTIELFEKHKTDLPVKLDSLIYFCISYSYFKLDKTDKAIALVQNVTYPNIQLMSSRDKEIIAETFFELSVNCEKHNNLLSAITYLEKAIGYMPENQKFNDRLHKVKQLNSNKQKNLNRKKLKIVTLSLVVVIVATILIFSILKFLNVRKENIAWEQSQAKNTEQSYEIYLSDYPQGKYLKEAIVIKDSLAWANTKKINKINSYEDYIAKYPNGKYLEEAGKYLKEAIEIKDSLAWVNTKKINKISSYGDYIAKYPSGKYLKEAIEIKESFVWTNTKKINKIKSYEDYITKYPSGKHKLLAIDSLKQLKIRNAGLIFVQGGTFQMGGNERDQEKPVHSVTVSDFYIGKHEVTRKEWKKVTGNMPSSSWGGVNNKPADDISWFEVIEFCNKKSDIDGLNRCYRINKNKKDPNNKSESSPKWIVTCNFNANGYRLPTEAEWEYVARGGNKSKGYKYSGSNNIDDVAWYSSNSTYTHEVGTKQANELGIYDMSGNVAEMCWDWFGEYSSSSQTNPRGPSSGKNRVVRAGRTMWCWVSSRCGYKVPWCGHDETGFRLVSSK